VWISPKTDFSGFQMDELWHFISKRPRTETRENVYLMTMTGENPRQIVGFAASFTKTAVEIQEIADSVPAAERYFTDGNTTYCDVVFGGKHVRNIHDKKDTHDVESVNSDIRTYIAGLARRSRCFFRNLDTLNAVLAIFVDAYNKFGAYKQRHRVPVSHKLDPTDRHLHKFRDLPLGILNFV
jgi:IS1 family transposase